MEEVELLHIGTERQGANGVVNVDRREETSWTRALVSVAWSNVDIATLLPYDLAKGVSSLFQHHAPTSNGSALVFGKIICRLLLLLPL